MIKERGGRQNLLVPIPPVNPRKSFSWGLRRERRGECVRIWSPEVLHAMIGCPIK